MCWGDDTHTQSSPPAYYSFLRDAAVNMSIGSYHGCAVDRLGSLKCWGINDDGESDPPTL